MATINMKCPNCGGNMTLVNNQFICPNCRTQLLNIVDAKIDSDVTVMTPDEFERKIEESKRQFVVNIDGNFKVFDVDTMVINKKLQNASEKLSQGYYKEVFTILNEIPHDYFPVERLRLLATFEARNEYELSFYDGYIDVPKNRYETNFYDNIIKLADEQTRATYEKIALYCREQYDTKRHIESEITEVNKLLDVKLYQEAIAYTKEMCRKYPQTALSWAYACEAKCKISENYNCKYEFSMMQKCPDCDSIELPKLLYAKVLNARQSANNFKNAQKEHTLLLKTLTILIWIFVFISLIVHLVFKNNVIAFPLDEVSKRLKLFGGIILGVLQIVLLLRSLSLTVKEQKLLTLYHNKKDLIPKNVEEYQNVETNVSTRTVFRILIGLGIIAYVILFTIINNIIQI